MNKRFQRHKRANRLLNELLLEKAQLNTRPGRFLRDKYPKISRKARKHDGRKYPKIFFPQRLLDEEGIFIDYYFDPWNTYLDGQRDRSRIGEFHYCYGEEFWRKEIKKKIKKQIKIRKARKLKFKGLFPFYSK